ncbi:MAG: hypothetical protein R3C03_12435 [Pirellulaceae bacterium]
MTTIVALYVAYATVNPLGAWLIGLVVGPAIVRLAIVSDYYFDGHGRLIWTERLAWFAMSVFNVFICYVAAVISFWGVVLLFGLVASLFSMVTGNLDLGLDSAVLGFFAGGVWGIAGALFAFVYVFYRTLPEKTQADGKQPHKAGLPVAVSDPLNQ